MSTVSGWPARRCPRSGSAEAVAHLRIAVVIFVLQSRTRWALRPSRSWRPGRSPAPSQRACRSAGSRPTPSMVSATSSGICVGPPISFGDGTSHGRLPAPPRALPRSSSHPTGSACRRAREPKARGCMIGAISRWPISRRKGSTETIMASGPAVCRSAETSPTAISPASPPGARRGHRSRRSSIAWRRRRQHWNRRRPRRPLCAPAASPGFALHPHAAAFPEALSAPRGQPPPAHNSRSETTPIKVL